MRTPTPNPIYLLYKKFIDKFNNFIDRTNANTILGTLVVVLMVIFFLLNLYLPKKNFPSFEQNDRDRTVLSDSTQGNQIAEEINTPKEETVPKKKSSKEKKVQREVDNSDATPVKSSVLEMNFDIPDAKTAPKGGKDDIFDYGDAFIQDVLKATKKHSKTSQIPTCIVVAQAILESNWGRSDLAKKHFNFFGIKKKNEQLTDRERQIIAGKIRIQTKEDYGSGLQTVSDEFNTYKSLEASVEHYYIFMQKRIEQFDSYKGITKVKKSDYKAMAKAIQKSGFSTDRQYAEKLIRIIEEHGLDSINY